ncbi:MAG: hypothetical protein F4Y58_02450 [Gammaproteobacteria bacterium]|nr:hypothetical protein [Gammaproteobacteria bacterium]
MNNDLRWKQQFQDFEKALKVFQRRIDGYEKHSDEEAYQLALVGAFELIHELSYKTLKYYLENEGVDADPSPKNVMRSAFQNELISKAELWMESINKRSRIVLAYETNVLREIIQFSTDDFYPIVRDLYFQLKKEL